MNTNQLRRVFSAGNLAFMLVVIAGFLVLITYPNLRADPGRLLTIASLGLVYLILGTWGWEMLNDQPLPDRWVWGYLVVQLILGGWMVRLSYGAGWLFLLPLVGHGVSRLPPWGGWVVCALILILEIFPWASGSTILDLLPNLFSFGAAILFVAVFTQLTNSEHKARADVERLAQQLSEANHKLREYATQVEDLAIANERNRLAREIHDGLGHYMTAINIQIKAAQAIMEQDPASAAASLQKAQLLTQEALADVRRSVSALRASPMESRPLDQALATLVQEARATGLAVELAVTGTPRLLEPAVSLALYRSVQEGLTNVQKHAQAKNVTVTLDYTHTEKVRLEICDNGLGTEETSPEGSFGLLGLRERALLLGGQLQVRSEAGHGFLLELTLPG